MRVVGLPKRGLRRGLPDIIRPSVAEGDPCCGHRPHNLRACGSAFRADATSGLRPLSHGPPTGSKPKDRAVWPPEAAAAGLK